MRGLTICLKKMITKKKVKEILRLKFAQTINKIMPFTFSKKNPIIFLPLKCLSEVMLLWHLYNTFIWYCWYPSTCELILRIHHRCINCSEQEPCLSFWKMRQSTFVGFFHCDIHYPVLHIQF